MDNAPFRRRLPHAWTALFGILLAACGSEPDLVVYVAHDQFHSEPLIQRFEQETGLSVRAEYDVEANKTVGLVRRLREERQRIRCDVFWNNEFANTVALADEGLLATYDSPAAAEIPETFRDPGRRWNGFAARARVFIVNTDEIDPTEITSLDDLVDPRFAGRVGMARPLTGTTLTHAASWFESRGETEALEFLAKLKSANQAGNLSLFAGNGHVMRTVREGRLAFGLTDTDDFNVAREEGYPVVAVYPDQDSVGTLLIPNTVAILEGAPHRAAAERFVDWLLSSEVERTLAFSRAAQIPVRPDVERPAHVADGSTLRFTELDYGAVGRNLVERQQVLKELFVE